MTKEWLAPMMDGIGSCQYRSRNISELEYPATRMDRKNR